MKREVFLVPNELMTLDCYIGSKMWTEGHERNNLSESEQEIWDQATEFVTRLLRNLPATTIDAEPVRHGRWMPVTCENHPKIILGCTGYMCSECGRIEEENSEPYCHCGAKMDGGDPHD